VLLEPVPRPSLAAPSLATQEPAAAFMLHASPGSLGEALLLPERRRQVEQLAVVADPVLRFEGVPVALDLVNFELERGADARRGKVKGREGGKGSRDAHVILRGFVALEEVAHGEEGVLAHGCVRGRRGE